MRNQIEDIILKKKSIRQVPIPKGRKFFNSVEHPLLTRPKTNLPETREESAVETRRSESKSKKVSTLKRTGLWLGLIVVLLFVFAVIFSFFATAVVTVTPKMTDLVLEDNLVAYKSPTEGELGFEIVTIKKTVSREVEATEAKKVDLKASGKITIYNNYNTLSQRLIKNTRFESVSGKIYRITDSVTVPGQKKVDGKLIPGSVTASVLADNVGEAFNLKLADLQGDFTIPGFKGSPRYNTFYARLATDITGGFSGLTKQISADTQKTVEAELKEELKKVILNEVSVSKPENFSFFENGYFWDFGTLQLSSTSAKTATVSLEGSFNGFLFSTQKLAQYFAKNKISGYQDEAVDLIWGDDIVFTLANPNKETAPWLKDKITFGLKGKVTIVWPIDTEQIKNSLSGASRSDIYAKMTAYSDIVKTTVEISPFWRLSLPADTSKIVVEKDLNK